MKIGYVAKRNLELNPHLAEKFKFKEASFTRRISSRGDRVVDNANWMKDSPGLILVGEPFLLDDELREKCLRWCEWANKVDESEYSFFADRE